MNDDLVSIWDALLVFVDVVDSSVHSSMLGIENFAREVTSFQDLFRVLGNQCFKDKASFEEKVTAWCEVDVRGDEGFVFVIDPEQTAVELIDKAVRLAFDLKTRMKIMHRNKKDRPPKEMEIAVGIHYGEVATINRLITTEHGQRRLIDKVLGYSINYAKRVETSSRVGRFSRVFLSKKAADLASRLPLALYKHEVPLKGIKESEEVYEVRSVLLGGVPIRVREGSAIVDEEAVVRYFRSEAGEEDFLRDSWLRSVGVSVLGERKDAVKGTTEEKTYTDRIDQIAWGKLVEDDPILLYWRAKVCENSGKYSRAISYLKKTTKECPQLISARTGIIENCYRMIKKETKVSADMVFVRDTVEELLDLERYERRLSEKERKRLEEILEETEAA
jgi:class 3 adenylate cyclase